MSITHFCVKKTTIAQHKRQVYQPLRQGYQLLTALRDIHVNHRLERQILNTFPLRISKVPSTVSRSTRSA